MRGEVHILVYSPIDTFQWGSTHSALCIEQDVCFDTRLDCRAESVYSRQSGLASLFLPKKGPIPPSEVNFWALQAQYNFRLHNCVTPEVIV